MASSVDVINAFSDFTSLSSTFRTMVRARRASDAILILSSGGEQLMQYCPSLGLSSQPQPKQRILCACSGLTVTVKSGIGLPIKKHSFSIILIIDRRLTFG